MECAGLTALGLRARPRIWADVFGVRWTPVPRHRLPALSTRPGGGGRRQAAEGRPGSAPRRQRTATDEHQVLGRASAGPRAALRHGPRRAGCCRVRGVGHKSSTGWHGNWEFMNADPRGKSAEVHRRMGDPAPARGAAARSAGARAPLEQPLHGVGVVRHPPRRGFRREISTAWAETSANAADRPRSRASPLAERPGANGGGGLQLVAPRRGLQPLVLGRPLVPRPIDGQHWPVSRPQPRQRQSLYQGQAPPDRRLGLDDLQRRALRR